VTQHHPFDLPLIRRGVKVEIAAEIRPVIERLHHCNRAAVRLKLVADMTEMRQRVPNSELLPSDNTIDPVAQLRARAGVRCYNRECAHYDVVRLS